MIDDILFVSDRFETRSKTLVSGTISGYSMDGVSFDFTSGAPIQTNFTLVLSNIIVGTEVRIYRTDNRNEIAGIESIPTSIFTYNYTYGSDISCYIVFINTEYEYLNISNITITNKDNIIPIQQRKRIF